MPNLSARTKIVSILAPDAAASADRNSDVIDTLGFDAVLICVQFGAIASSAVTNIQLAHADAASNNTTLTSGQNIATSSQTVADDDDDQIFYIDVIELTKRYLQVTVNKDASNNTTEGIIAILYNSKSSQPTTHGAGGATIGEGEGSTQGELLIHPIDGTI